MKDPVSGRWVRPDQIKANDGGASAKKTSTAGASSSSSGMSTAQRMARDAERLQNESLAREKKLREEREELKILAERSIFAFNFQLFKN